MRQVWSEVEAVFRSRRVIGRTHLLARTAVSLLVRAAIASIATTRADLGKPLANGTTRSYTRRPTLTAIPTAQTR